MAGRTLDRHAREAVDIVVRMLALKARLRVTRPAEVAKLKRLLGASCGISGTALPADCGLFFHVACLLSGRPEALTMGELSAALDVPLSTATRLIGWQVAHGYVERHPDPHDRRVVRVALSPAGRRVYASLHQVLRQKVRRVAREFTAEEREALLPLLRKLVGVLAEQQEPRARTRSREPGPEQHRRE